MSETIFAAHRGYSSIAPENTTASFEEAVKHGFGGVECDIWEVKPDGCGPEFMVMHDENLSRMCGVNVRITKMTRRELAEYPVIKGKNIDRYGGSQPIPTFEEYLDILSDSAAVPIIEVKSRKPETEENAVSEAAAKRLTELLYEKISNRRAVLQSFNLHSLYRLLPFLRPGTDLLYLVKESELIKKERLEAYKASGISGISAKKTILSSASISRIHKCKLMLGVWTVDSKITARKLEKTDHAELIISNKIVFK